MKLRIGLSILLLASTPVMAADSQPTRYPQTVKPLQGPTLEQRIGTLERTLRNQSMADIVLTLQRLQQEVQQLRGEVELQNHTMDALKKQQRDLYLDLDGRISRLQKAPVASTPVMAQPVAVAPVVASAVVPQPVATVATTTPPVVVSTAPLVAADPALEEETYQAAFKLLQQAHYAEAITAFNAFLQRYPSGSYADNAQYWLGEASYVTRDFTQALADFDLLQKSYPDSPKVRGALLKSGYIYYEQKYWEKARKVLEQLIYGFPGSSEARLAETRLLRISNEGH